MALPSYNRVRQLLDYDPDTGLASIGVVTVMAVRAARYVLARLLRVMMGRVGTSRFALKVI